MTDTVKTLLSLKKLPELVRMDVPAQLCNVSNPWGELQERYVKPSKQKSSMVDTYTKWIVRCVPGTGDLEGLIVPAAMEASISIPNAVVGQNILHGTSVFAAGIAAFYLQRNWLAKAGLPREQLDLLDASDVSLTGATVAFILRCPDRDKSEDMVMAIKDTAKVLYGADCLSYHSGNETVVIPARDFSVHTYVKSDFSHCVWSPGSPENEIKADAQYLVRIEAKLGEPFLKKLGLTTLESWRDAYARGVYKDIFNATVRKSLRLTGQQLRHRSPRAEVFGLLTPTQSEVLRGYLADPPVDPRNSDTVVNSANPSKRFSELRKPILKHARIDINIPWEDHVKLRCFELEETLVYPGDFHPDEDHTTWSFCESNWDALRDKLNRAYEDALMAAARTK